MLPYFYIVNVEGAIVKHGRYLMIVRGSKESHGAGGLGMPGGKVEKAVNSDSVLEETLRREIKEEVGIEVYKDMEYVESSSFMTEKGEQVIDVVFLCRYKSGSPTISDPGEVADITWMTYEDILKHPKLPKWTCQSIELAEQKRIEKQW